MQGFQQIRDIGVAGSLFVQFPSVFVTMKTARRLIRPDCVRSDVGRHAQALFKIPGGMTRAHDDKVCPTG